MTLTWTNWTWQFRLLADLLDEYQSVQKPLILMKKRKIMTQGSKTKTNKNGGNQEVEIAQCHKGQDFGELALVTNKPRAASAYVVGDVKCLVMDLQAFERFLGPRMDIMKRNISHYEEQLVKMFGSNIDLLDPGQGSSSINSAHLLGSFFLDMMSLKNCHSFIHLGTRRLRGLQHVE
ncbi:hypothetical protein A6R68_09653 [Neotoma lepida]|uniref:cAMP-dependent protein kinase type II-alpha regulatory subunit n=1 Tax=Neotoma lepida TaxID=56216 RepID=A0A1A6G086_NEOLE|nr:hypothetical protein A6R68_09653 [Neotoma lepida]